MAVNVDKHQINELTEDIVNDLLKNAFKQEPVNIENDKKKEDEEADPSLENKYLELNDEDDNLNVRCESVKNQEISKEEAQQIKSPVKVNRNVEQASSEGEQSQEEEEYMELGYQDINDVLYTDTKVMNFGTFMPGGKLLGSNLMI